MLHLIGILVDLAFFTPDERFLVREKLEQLLGLAEPVVLVPGDEDGPAHLRIPEHVHLVLIVQIAMRVLSHHHGGDRALTHPVLLLLGGQPPMVRVLVLLDQRLEAIRNKVARMEYIEKFIAGWEFGPNERLFEVDGAEETERRPEEKCVLDRKDELQVAIPDVVVGEVAGLRVVLGGDSLEQRC